MSRVLVLHNRPVLGAADPDRLSEQGVLETVAAVVEALNSAGYTTKPLAVANPLDELLPALRDWKPDVVFNLFEGIAGNSRSEAQFAGLLELAGVSYTGSPPEAIALLLHKPRAKWLLAGAGVPTAEFLWVQAGHAVDSAALSKLLEIGPVFVKPALEDASIGIDDYSVATDRSKALKKIQSLQARYGDVLVERYIAGREFNVGVIDGDTTSVLPVAEIIFGASAKTRWPIVTYDAKWSTESADYKETPVACPAEVEPGLQRQIETAALAAFRASGCRDYARVDIRVNPEGKVFVLEVNPNPDLSPSAGFARALEVAGIGHSKYVLALVEQALKRKPISNAAASTASVDLTGAKQAAPINELTFRCVEPADLEPLVQILRDCAVFRPDEVVVGEEVLVESLKQGADGDYKVVVAELDGAPVGWSCHGLVPLTDATYDLYWIAVSPRVQGIGVGRRLLTHVEEMLRSAGARWLIAETSENPQYVATRAFYERTGYELCGHINDFYRAGDGRVVYGKRLDTLPADGPN